MNAVLDDGGDEVEALREFIYLMPIGVLRFARSGAVSMINPAAVQILAPFIGNLGFGNIFITLATLCPDLMERVDALTHPTGTVVEERRIDLRLGSKHQALSLTVSRVRPDTYMAILKDVTARSKVGVTFGPVQSPALGGRPIVASWYDTETDELEELRHFIYLMPIGVMRFADNGAVSMLNPMVSALLMPHVTTPDLSNIYASLAALCPDLRARVAAFAQPSGTILDQHSLTGVTRGQAVTLSLTVTRVQPGTHMAVLKDITRMAQIQAEAKAADAALRAEIEARRVTELQLIQAQKMETVGQLTGGLAHDFNNLLAVVILNLELLGDRWPHDRESQELIADAMGAATRGAELTHQLLAFSRRQRLAARPTELNEVIESFVRLLRRTLGTDITIAYDLAADLWPVMIDRVQFEAAIANLANNARDAMPRGGTLTIATRNSGGLEMLAGADASLPQPEASVTIEIRDTGHGMTPEVQQRIFEPFFTTKPTGRGTGLGLSMTFGFIRQSGGRISVQSTPLQGAVFTIVLPALSPVAVAEVVRPKMPPVAAVKNLTVLVVDDNDALRRVLTRQIARAGYTVLEAVDAEQALTILAGNGQIDLLLTDIVMPGGMDGYELALAALGERPGLKAIFTSGFDGTPDIDLDARFSGKIIKKPYRMQDMLRFIEDELGRTE